LSSQLKQISTPRKCSRGGKWIYSRPRKRKISDANISATVPNALLLNIESLSASKICVIEQLAIRHKDLIIFLQETRYTNVDGMIIPNFTPTGSTVCSKHAVSILSSAGPLLTNPLMNQQLSGCASTWMDIRSLISANLLLPDLHLEPFHCSLTPVSILVILIANIQTGNTTTSVQVENAWFT